jgi:hypothetical protein
MSGKRPLGLRELGVAVQVRGDLRRGFLLYLLQDCCILVDSTEDRRSLVFMDGAIIKLLVNRRYRPPLIRKMLALPFLVLAIDVLMMVDYY